jgi:hypothetical protein
LAPERQREQRRQKRARKRGEKIIEWKNHVGVQALACSRGGQAKA